MTAAATCPKCGHGFELRDGFGELFPLAYCSSCQSYYRESLGECRWCGTKPERAPIAPNVWRGAGIAALVVVVGIGWLLRGDGSTDAASRRTKAVAKSQSTTRHSDTTGSPTTAAVGDTAVLRTPIASVDNVDRDSVLRVTTTGEVSRAPTPPAPAPPSGAMLRPGAASSPAVQPTNPPVAPTPTTSRQSTRWVSSISRDWVVVRAGADKRSRLIASIGPNSRVQLGELRGEWRRIRAKGLNGWVDQRAEFRVSSR